MNEISQEVRISNKRGLHARASAKFVTLASGLPADITVSKDGNHVTGTSIMGLMMLGAAMGDHIVIKATGPEASDSLEKLVTLVEDKFGEE
jgi:phosphocarrier protein HPr